MTNPDMISSEMIDRARAGDQNALGKLLEHHRGYLRVIAERMIGGRLRSRLDASDIVQQTCLSAFGNIQEFEGDDASEFLAWLRTIHERNVKNALRDHVGAQKRSVTREKSMESEVEIAGPMAIEKSSPSQRMMLGEQAVQLAQALQHLPEDQREAVRLRYLEGWSLARISEFTGRTKFSVAGLVKRGLLSLRKHLRTENV
jgi:RNA polymerase sigma-70 factor (ECF subfamily)